MARISFPEAGLGEHADWMLARPEMAAGMAAFSTAVYGTSTLAKREREVARYTIALINDCKVCRAARARDAEAAHIDETFYTEIPAWRTSPALSDRERLAAEFAQLFATDHLAMDDGFWGRLRAFYRDDEIADLTMSCGAWLGMGRAMAVIGVRAPDEQLLV
ncbi:MAG: carboxymuconolactone decarboxylase family protein [Actinomycetota bacterium]|nr:carboxymuconolactone decarboxylase family protein [Actinomycetota bacterium]